MAWTTPRTWVAGELVTSTTMNTHVRDNLNILKTNIADDGGLFYSNTYSKQSPSAGSDVYLALVRGRITEASSGTHPMFATLALSPPTIIGGAADVNHVTSLYITGAGSGGVVSNTAAFIVGDVLLQGKLLMSASVVSGLNDGDIAMGNNKFLRGLNAAGTTHLALIGLDASNRTELVLQSASLVLTSADTAASATAGTSGAPPAQVAGYLNVVIGGAPRKIPYYAN